MLSHQIYVDSKENGSSSAKNLKLSSNDKPKGLGLKNSTNINYEKKLSSNSPEKIKKEIAAPAKNLKKENPNNKHQLAKNLKKSEDLDEFPEIENMYIYNETHDDYEDILPKCERINKKDIECFYQTCYIGRVVELTAEELPRFTLDKIDFDEDYFLPSPDLEFNLYDNTKLVDIPEPDLLFD